MREEVPAALDGQRLDRVVAMVTGLARAAVADLVASGAVRVDGAVVTKPGRKVVEGEVVEADVADADTAVACAPDASVDVTVVHVDDDVIVVDKPAGLVVHPGAGNRTGTVIQGLLARYPELAAVGDPARPGVVHRLDRGTSGLLVVARSPRAYTSLVTQLAERRASRRYTALVWGHLDATAGLIDAPIGRAQRDRTKMAVSASGRDARTRYEVVREYTDPVDVTLLECALETGRTHQIRVHLNAIGHPVVGDDRYRGARKGLPVTLARHFLHARELAFDHPATGERVTFESPLPPELTGLLEHLG
jgi:23S rRNA pseudouridine1911/1915/1917 synthase